MNNMNFIPEMSSGCSLEFMTLSLAVIKKKFKQISLVAVNYWYSAVYGVYAKSCFYFSKNQR
jgi:hypothetical protein